MCRQLIYILRTQPFASCPNIREKINLNKDQSLCIPYIISLHMTDSKKKPPWRDARKDAINLGVTVITYISSIFVRLDFKLMSFLISV
jgi:hypothetical protein